MAGPIVLLGPDNGVLGVVATKYGVAAVTEGRSPLRGTPVVGVTLTNPAYFLPRVSATFHGRDVFAPVAAHLSLGVPLTALGPPLDEIVVLARPGVERYPGKVVGHVRYVDRFGNAITDLGRVDLEGLTNPIVDVAGRHILGLSHHDAEKAGLLALMGSSDRLEIALNGGSAAAALGLTVGDSVVVREADHS